MIAVIADDFTGAAEIGGIGIRHGLKVTILKQIVKKIDADLLIIATDTRSKNRGESDIILNKITKDLLALHPTFIYKKIDSLLRGNVGEELITQLIASKKAKALIIPANPILKRIIKDGIYYVNGIPLKEYLFSGESTNSRKSSKVRDLIAEEIRPFTKIISIADVLPKKGLIIGNAVTENDLTQWTQKVDSRTIPSGSSGFFDALIKANFLSNKEKEQLPICMGKKIIYVCGSAFIGSRQLVREAKESGQTVVFMPADLPCNPEPRIIRVTHWAEEIIRNLNSQHRIILAVDQINCDDKINLPLKIKEAFADVVIQVMNKIAIDELIIEGGATAFSIMEKLGYKTFFPLQELGLGVIRMKVEENKRIHLTLKPGSYQWPKSIWQY